jgi:uncharacterized membrane protein SirB2
MNINKVILDDAIIGVVKVKWYCMLVYIVMGIPIRSYRAGSKRNKRNVEALFPSTLS